jgi:hypothetical protein
MVMFPTRCPGCGEGLRATRLSCGDCQTQVEGRFELPALLRLPAEDLEFVVAFVLASGSLKEMASQRRQSYPTIRNRLDGIIEQLRSAEHDREEKRAAILEAVATKKITVAEATNRLKRS